LKIHVQFLRLTLYTISVSDGYVYLWSPYWDCPAASELYIGTESSEVQVAWLGALDDMGVEVLMSTDEQEEKVRSATSIFEFEAKTIDGELVSLDKYRGHVTLIVNVASQ
jgi:hypothetical protein